MRHKSKFNAVVFLAVGLIPTTAGKLNAQIASSYPFDNNIQKDSNVIFVEMFEGSVNNLISSGNWNKISPNASNILSDPSVPKGSPGNKSLRLVTIQDGTNTNQNTLLYKLIAPDIVDSIFVRYYIKYDTNTIYHHSGLWIGGKNPPANIPGNIGGNLPSGNKEFHVGTEIKDIANGRPTANSLFGLYTYWMGMHQSSLGPYYGNQFYNNTSFDNIELAAWNCIEVMIKLNDPVSSSNGAIKLWVNGILVSDLGYQFPTGTWNYNYFTEGAGLPFEGFQFRNDKALNLNYLWLRNFNDQNPPNHMGNVYFDHLVVAKKYIGPISTNVATANDERNSYPSILAYPNPADEVLDFSAKVKVVRVFNIFGRLILKRENVNRISTEEFQNGLYLIETDNKLHKIFVSH
ncbi:MAG: hypothetical protein IPM34_13470 [Saprospiraceae bacterium]|nr:hypothetical protein [Saprospiraceae bacterium]